MGFWLRNWRPEGDREVWRRRWLVQRRFGADRAVGRGSDLGAESLSTSGAEMQVRLKSALCLSRVGIRIN